MNSPLLVGFVASFTLIAAIGAQNAFVLRQGIRREHVLPVVALCTVSDIVADRRRASPGSARSSTPTRGAMNVAKFGGALFLFGYGLLAARRAWRPSTPHSAQRRHLARLAEVLVTCRRTARSSTRMSISTPSCCSARSPTSIADDRWLFGVGAVTASAVWFVSLGLGARRLAGLVRRPADVAHPRRADRGDRDRPGRLAALVLKTNMPVNGRVTRFMSHNQCMSEPARSPSLRERKKVRTRETIRREAFRLFDERGYDQTTIEHIADAADISPSTYFRYFPSKESVLLADDLSMVMLEALAGQPVEMTPIAAFRQAVHDAYEHMTAEEWDVEKTRQRLIYSLAELQPALREEYNSLVAGVAEAMARRLQRGPHELEIRAFAGAVIGAVMALGNRGPFSLDNVDQAMNVLESGLTLD